MISIMIRMIIMIERATNNDHFIHQIRTTGMVGLTTKMTSMITMEEILQVKV